MEYEKFGVQYLEQAIEECSEAPTRELFLFQAAHMVLPVTGTGRREINLAFQASQTTPVVGEIRPVNRAVRYLIRARWLAKIPGTSYPQNRKGQSAGNTLPPGTGWFFKGLPSGKRFWTYLPDGDP